MTQNGSGNELCFKYSSSYTCMCNYCPFTCIHKLANSKMQKPFKCTYMVSKLVVVRVAYVMVAVQYVPGSLLREARWFLVWVVVQIALSLV